MNKGFSVFSVAVIVGLFFGMSVSAAYGAVTSAQSLNLPMAETGYVIDDESRPDVTDRVARISYILGEAKIRRLESDEWEKVTRNLPIVEGDEITTDEGARIEIQFSKDQYLRLAENSYIKIVNLKDDGIAVSLSLGTLSLRVKNFDKEKSFFEIDAPKTTMALKASGSYRIDAGNQGDQDVRLTVTDGGEARVYSDNAGFTLRDGRSSRLFIAGDRVGEWETTAAARYRDDFAFWTAERDSTITNLLKAAYYDKYYDDDIYGAEDLNDNGDWIHTRNYGYVWRPSRQATVHYADWSPYRYGHWRWVPPYGWTWVNDEPWGWSTYHHGRWFYYDGYWNWSPYGYYRQARSWWAPALVVFSIVNTNICWYPLPYHRPRYNYNHHNRGPRGNGQPIVTPPANVARTKPPKPDPDPGFTGKLRKPGDNEFPVEPVPPKGVVTIGAKDFGLKVKGVQTAPASVAKTVLAKFPDDGRSMDLPNPGEKRRRSDSDIRVEKPPVDISRTQAKIGAATRRSDSPMDNELRQKRMYGDRPPLRIDNEPTKIKSVDRRTDEPRDTGVMERRPSVKREIPAEPEPMRPVRKDAPDVQAEPQFKRPVIKDAPRYEPPPEREPMRYDPPPQRYDPPPQKEKPRYDPPARREEPRYEPPPREKPRVDTPPAREPQRIDPPVDKGTPKQEKPPSAPAPVPRKVKPDDVDN